MVRIPFLPLTTSLLLLTAACHHKQDDLQPPAPVTFTQTIHPILTVNCTPCHQGPAPGGDGHLSDGPIPFVDAYETSK